MSSMNTNVDPFNKWSDDNQTETHELNERAPINHNPNSYMSGEVRETSVESLNIDTMQTKGSTSNAGFMRSHFNEVPVEGSYVLLWKYSGQIKSILAGLLLLFCGGMHTVWSIYQVLFYKTSEEYRKNLNATNNSTWANSFLHVIFISKPFGLMLTIAMWYVGMALGCFMAGWYMVPNIQKKNIYYIAALIMFVSGCTFYGASVSEIRWQPILLVARLIAGIGHGVTYVTVFVQASENSSKDFRRVMVTIIGLTLALSIFIASTFIINIPMPIKDKTDNEKTVELSETTSTGIMATVTVILCFISVPINFIFSYETVPFLLYHNNREEEAQSTLAQLLGEDQHSPIVQHEFNAMRELCNDDYAEFPEGKIFTTIHRRLMSIPLYSRIVSAQCLNVLSIIMFANYIINLMEKDVILLETNSQNSTKEEFDQYIERIRDIMRLARMYLVVVKVSFATWFIVGVPLTFVGNYFNWKRGYHFCTSLAGAIMLSFTLFHWIGIFGGFFKASALLFLNIYIHFMTIPVDIIGYLYLMECFPTSTKSRGIAFVTICESLFNSIFIYVEIQYDSLGIEFFAMAILYFILGFLLYAVVPNTNGLSLAATKHAYMQALSPNWWEFYKKK